MRLFLSLIIGLGCINAEAQNFSVGFGYRNLSGYNDRLLRMNFLGMDLGFAAREKCMINFGIHSGFGKQDFRSNEYQSQTSGMVETINATIMNRKDLFSMGFAVPVVSFLTLNRQHFIEINTNLTGIRSLSKVNFASSEVPQFPEENSTWDVHQKHKINVKYSLEGSLGLRTCLGINKMTFLENEGLKPYLFLDYRVGFGGMANETRYNFTSERTEAKSSVKEEKSGNEYYFRESHISNKFYGWLSLGLVWRIAPSTGKKKPVSAS